MQSEGLHSAEFLSEVAIIIFKTSKTSASPLAISIPVNFDLLQILLFLKRAAMLPKQLHFSHNFWFGLFRDFFKQKGDIEFS